MGCGGPASCPGDPRSNTTHSNLLIQSTQLQLLSAPDNKINATKMLLSPQNAALKAFVNKITLFQLRSISQNGSSSGPIRVSGAKCYGEAFLQRDPALARLQTSQTHSTYLVETAQRVPAKTVVVFKSSRTMRMLATLKSTCHNKVSLVEVCLKRSFLRLTDGVHAHHKTHCTNANFL